MNTTVKQILGMCFLVGIFLIAVNHSLFDAFALSLCAGGFVWIVFDRRIENLRMRVAILERGGSTFRESVEGLYRSETVIQESMGGLSSRIDSLHESVDTLHESVDKISRRVDCHSEWFQSLQEDRFPALNDDRPWTDNH